MGANVRKLNTLLEEGYDLRAIASDHRRIVVTVFRGWDEVTLRLDRSDAEELVFGRALSRRR